VPASSQLHDLACVVHLHSTHSDGTGTVRQIAKAARRSGVDVVLLTDHDTLAARENGEEGWYGERRAHPAEPGASPTGSVLVLVGEEVSPTGRDHYLAFDVDHLIDRRLSGDEICRAVRDAGGFGFAAHPMSKGSERFKRGGSGMPFGHLDCGALHGFELWSFATDTAESLPSLGAALKFIASPGRVLEHPPERNVREWDRLCRERRTVAIGGLDAHQFGIRIGPVVPLRLMSYRRSFSQLRTHVLADGPLTGDLGADRELVYSALRAGRCYIAVDAIAPARGFSFHAEGPAGRLEMGAEAQAGDWTLHARLPAPARLRLLRNGEEIASLEAPVLAHHVLEPGVYRVEALRESHGRERTWVISNPIYLR
jgi:hypothetical protein